MNTEELLMFNDCRAYFNEQLYADIFTPENLVSMKKCITIDGSKIYGYFLEKGKERYFIPDKFLKDLPFKSLEMFEIDYKSDVYKLIKKVDSITIPAELRMTFRRLVDLYPNFQHSNPKHFLLYKIIAIAGWCDRANFRVSTEAGFGKDSVLGIHMDLLKSTVNIYGATFAKLEYSLTNKVIALNEMGNLKKEDKDNMQEFLLAVGAMHNTYNKRSRKTETTQEIYDISKISLMVLYNLPSYYTNKTQEYFDQMFTEAVTDRFIPFVFEGRLTTKFETVFDTKRLVDENQQIYKDIIATMNWYQRNPVVDIKYKVDETNIKFSKKLQRYQRSFNILLKYVSEYCKTQEEFNDLSLELFKCYDKYKTLTITGKGGLK